MTPTLEAAFFREVLGQYPTGVVVVTAIAGSGDPLGMTVGSFTSVSLDPPLVAFMPSKTSSSWHALRETGDRYCINVLSADQEVIGRNIAVRKSDKFSDIEWRVSDKGNPLIDGAVAHIDCRVEAIHDAGDHEIVVARVEDLGMHNSAYPLLFFRGGYGSFMPQSLATREGDLIDQLKAIDIARPHMEALASHFDTEVAAMARVGAELVLAATSGRVPGAVTPTRVGQRLPFMPPLGSVFAAWGDEKLRDTWIAQADHSSSDRDSECYPTMPERVRARGYAVALGHREVEHLERTWTRLNDGDSSVSMKSFRAELKLVSRRFNPEDIDDLERYELRSLAAPVFDPDGEVAFTLTAWGPPGDISRSEFDSYVEQLLKTCAAASEAIACGHRGVE